MKVINMIKNFLYNVLCFVVWILWSIVVLSAMLTWIWRAMVNTFKNKFIEDEPTETE